MTSRRSLVVPLTLLALLALSSCGDDETTNPISTVASIDLESPATFLAVDGTLQLSAIPRDAGGAPVAQTVTWSSSDTLIATVDQTGLVHGVSLGNVRITASAGDKSAGVDLTVRQFGAELSGRIERARITLEAGVEYHATGDLELVADSVLKIDGTLMIDDGVAVSIGSYDSTIITGDIVPADAGAGPVFALGSKPSFRARRVAKDVTLWGPSLMLGRSTGQSNIQATGSVYIGGVEGTRGVGELIIENAKIEGGTGTPGTKTKPNGGPGGNVEVGTEAARAAAGAAAGRTSPPFPYIGFKGSVSMRGGPGGDGFSVSFRADAMVANNAVMATAGNGGRGGSLLISAGDISFSNATAYALTGGKGGGGGWVAFNIAPDLILDGSGPNGEGESLSGMTGAGNQGGDVSVVAATIFTGGESVVDAGRGGSPGFFFAKGGNGMNAGSGGNFTARIGLKGSPGTATFGGSTLPEPDPPARAIARVENAMNGGASSNPSRNGGAAGNLDVADAAGNGAAYVEPIAATMSLNGGGGYSGCADDPQRNGTNGGPAGTLRSFGVALGASNLSFFGGHGGDGILPGGGGDEGRNLDTNQPLGLRGFDGMECPKTLLISADRTELAFTHTVGVTECPQIAEMVTITNISDQQISVTPTVQNTNKINFDTVSFGLAPDESRVVHVIFNCIPPNLSFTATVRFVANPGPNEQIIDIPLAATIITPG